MEKEAELLKLLGLSKTKAILEFMEEHGTVRYKQMAGFVNVHILNLRLRKLLEFGLIEYHIERIKTKKEWYTITEKGKKILKHLQEIVLVVNESEWEDIS